MASLALCRQAFRGCRKSTLSKVPDNCQLLISCRNFSTAKKPSFGLLFDIDGVLVRGKRVLPFAPECFKKLIDPKTKKFRIPTVFVTNAGNGLCKSKAEQLSNWLEVEVTEDRVVMAHTPFKVFEEFHDKVVLVSGQGPLNEIATNLGFKKIVTIDDLRKAYPQLDAVDHKRRASMTEKIDPNFPAVEVVFLLGEPVRWETTLQLVIDLLLTNGVPRKLPDELPYPHIPVLACNMDLQWMAEAAIPRFGHGAFLLCLESLYHKITGKQLIYNTLLGKPSEITYQYAHKLLLEQAKDLGVERMNHIYCIGDNVNTDIYGANLYNEFLTSLRDRKPNKRVQDMILAKDKFDSSTLVKSIDSCHSILVKTGVFSNEILKDSPDHSQRDFLMIGDHLREAHSVIDNVNIAIDEIFRRENFS
ncbi:unnamed protein product [Bemisia tabaci]|uniref:Haloacid dehalogenase-like hydrolase domain-containing 5 n=1 Tax=Bemisia tabaci TaxID=7038 RepID=A0A9P0A0B6_BEMTA|nr:unnamed protein product [Bemisia tabaci]